MFRSVKATSVFVVAILLTLATPAAIDAAGSGTPRESAAAAKGTNSAIGRNLLRNGSFELSPSDKPIPAWSIDGAMHLERFGTRVWPDAAYSKKYNGGNDYLACSEGQGTVQQSVNWSGWRPRDYILKSRFSASFGGTIGMKIHAEVKMLGRGHTGVSRQRTKTLDIQNSYKRIVITLMVPEWTDHIRVTLQMMPKAGASKCDVIADSLNLTVFKP